MISKIVHPKWLYQGPLRQCDQITLLRVYLEEDRKRSQATIKYGAVIPIGATRLQDDMRRRVGNPINRAGTLVAKHSAKECVCRRHVLEGDLVATDPPPEIGF